MNYIKKLSLIIFLASVVACSSDDAPLSPELKVAFKEIGLVGKIINEIGFLNEGLYAAAADGIYIKDPVGNGNWVSLGLADKNVKTFVQINSQDYLASVKDASKGEHKLFHSSNGGQNWIELDNNFGGNYPEAANDFTFDQQNARIIASGNGVVAQSTDLGKTWVPLHGDWQMLATGLDFVEINPGNQDIWTGGQNGIEGFTLSRFSQDNKQWEDWINLLPSPSSGKDIAFAPNNEQTLVIGAEDGIILSVDNGKSWTTIKEDHDARFYFGVDYDQAKPTRMYAASWVKNFTDPQPLILYVSEDSGANWKEFKYNDETILGGVWDMVQRQDNGITKLYLGLYKGGVFEVTIE